MADLVSGPDCHVWNGNADEPRRFQRRGEDAEGSFDRADLSLFNHATYRTRAHEDLPFSGRNRCGYYLDRLVFERIGFECDGVPRRRKLGSFGHRDGDHYARFAVPDAAADETPRGHVS